MPKLRSWGRGRSCLVVGQSQDVRLRRALGELGLEADFAGSEAEAVAALERGDHVAAFVALQLGSTTLETIILRAGQRHPKLPVIVVGAGAGLQEAVDAMQLGAADFIAPPIASEVLATRLKRLVRDSGAAAASSPAPSYGRLGLVGTSPPMAKLFASIDRISRYKTNVLLLGESGSGKELIARALHACGPRRKHLFVPLNCATLGREMLENELFGHERGAYTGANERKKGLFELADGGTLFLDEIGELDPSTQAKLLRVIERNEFRRVGGTAKIKVDLSLVAATNRSLEDAIAAGRFREDLYYRLKVVTVVVPPLRERREDIPALIDAFIADFNRRNDGKIKGIAPQALRRLMEHDWPGNVRELKNAIDSAAVMAADETIGPDDLEVVRLDRTWAAPRAARRTIAPEAVDGAPSPASATIAVPASAGLAEVERLLILEHLRRARTKTEAARSLGIGLRTLYTKLRLLQVD
jgi:DNA-binding NtrC family response regulator